MICLVLTAPQAKADTPSYGYILFEDFEDMSLEPGMSSFFTGTFNETPGIKDGSIFMSSYAWGFGRSDCSKDCFKNYTSTLRIDLGAPECISSIVFDMAELYDNWGSVGACYLDGQLIPGSSFQRLPHNDRIADLTGNEVCIFINMIGQVLDLVVEDITKDSEIFIDNLRICGYEPHGKESFFLNFEEGVLPAEVSVIEAAAYTLPWGVRETGIFGSTRAFGFGKSDCQGNCHAFYTDLIITLPEQMYIASIQFKEAEADSNFGSCGNVYVDGRGVPVSTLGRIPVNDFEPDTLFREHIVPAGRIGSTVMFRVRDITDKSEIMIDDILIRTFEISGDPIMLADFEDGVLDPMFMIAGKGEYNTEPGIQDHSGTGHSKVFSFGRSTCGSGCFFQNSTSLFMQFPQPRNVAFLRFRTMETGSNWGSSGRVFINGVLYPNSDFGRQPHNDLESDTSFTDCIYPVHHEVQLIEFRVWDISNASEILIDDIMIHEGETTGLTSGEEGIPKVYALHQNYPNPFNASTAICYEIPVRTRVKVSLYDVRGRLIDVLLDRIEDAGRHVLSYTASLPSGVYVCRIETEKYRSMRKLVLIR